MSNFPSRALAVLAGLLLFSTPALSAQSAAGAKLRGDVDGDGRVTEADAQAVRAHLVGRPLPNGASILPAGDANGDGRITAVDAAVISRFVAGGDVSRFPVGKPEPGSEPTTPTGANGGGEMWIAQQCEADVLAGTFTCAAPTPQTGAVRADLILGNPGVTLMSGGAATYMRANSANEDTTIVPVRIRNNIGQPIGTSDGTTADPDGVRAFFNTGPVVTAVSSGTIAGASIRMAGTDSATFVHPSGSPTYPNKKFYSAVGVVATNAQTGIQNWSFVYSPNVTRFVYSIWVAAPVRYEFGWVDVTPANPAVGIGGTTPLTASPRNEFGASVGDAVTWASDNTGVATVDPNTGVVTGVSEGTAVITATSTSVAQRSGSVTVTVDAAPTVTSTSPVDGATDVATSATITVNFSESVNATTASFDLECPVGSDIPYGLSASPSASFTLTPSGNLPAATVCQVTVVAAQITDADTNDGPDAMAADTVFGFTTRNSLTGDDYPQTVIGNVNVNSANIPFSVLTNDQIAPGSTITFFGWGATSGVTKHGGIVSMTTSGAGAGQFTYNPPAGFEGADSLKYRVGSSAADTARVQLPVGGMIWFVNNNAGACSADCNGRLTNPFTTLAAFQAVNNGTGNNPAAGDNVFIYESSSPYAGPVTLLATQKLIGQDATTSLSALTGITPPSGSAALPAPNPGAGTVAINGTGGVTLAADNLLRGFALNNASGIALNGTAFGTLDIGEVPIQTGGQALALNTGTISGTLPMVRSTGGTNNVSLTGVETSGTLALGAAGDALSGATGTAFHVSGGGGSFSYSGNVTQANNAALVLVEGSHTGTLTFQTGTLSATNGTGLQFNAAGGTYNFNGTNTLTGIVGDGAINITNGSTGTFAFSAATSITDPTATAFRSYGGSPNVTYNGNISDGNGGFLAVFGESPGGTITFQTGTLGATAGDGIEMSNADGTVNFNGTTTLGGGNARVSILAGSSGTFGFGSGTTVTNPSGAAFTVAASSPNVTFSGSLTKNGASPGRLVDITGQAGGTITFQTGTLSSTSSAGTGIQLSDADGTVQFNGTTTLNGGDAGIDLTGGSNGTFTFGANALVQNTSGTAFNVNGSSPGVTFNGSLIRTANNALLVDITNNPLVAGKTILFDPSAGADSLYATVGDGILLSNVDGPVDFNGRVRLSGGPAVDVVSGSTGNIDFDAITVVNPATEALRIFNGSGGDQPADVSFAGAITTNAGRPALVEDISGGTVAVSASINATGQGLLVQNNSGGTITFSNATKTLNTGANVAVTMSSNANTTLNFTGGNLDIDTNAAGNAFTASGGGTLQITGSGNSINAVTGTALRVDGVTISPSALAFQRIDSSNGANGIFLNNVGTTASLTVSGTPGTNGSGGAITGTSGGDGATSGNGIYLNGARNANLSWMALSGHANNGLFGTGVRGLTMNKMRFTGNNGTSNSGTFDESAVNLVNLGGPVKVTNSRFDGGAYNAFRVENTSGTAPALDSLVIENDTVEAMQGSTVDVRGSAILVTLSDGTADVRIRNNRVTVWWANGIHSLIQGTASGTSRITNNFVDNTNGALAGAGGIAVVGGTHAYNISGNTVRHTDGTAISADRVNFGSTFQGTIDGNFVGVSGDNASGTKNGAGIFASHHGPGTTTHRISNNTIRQTQAHSGIGAIWVLTGDAPGFGGSGTLNATVVGNNIQENGTLVAPVNAHSGILATIGTTSGPPNDTDQVCMDIGGSSAPLRNTISNFNMGFSPGGHNRIRVNARFGTTTRYPGYTGAATGVTSQTDLAAYLLGRNTASNSTNANTSTGGFLNTSPAGSACPQPSL